MIANAESIIKWAMKIADELPEKYKQVAFAELLRYALKSASVFAESSTKEAPEGGSSTLPSPSWQERLVSELPEDDLIAAKGSRDQQTVFAVIKLGQKEHEVGRTQVIEYLEGTLGIPPESPSNTSTRLKNLTPEYLTKKEKGKGQGYSYRPTRRASEIFQGLEE